MIKNYQLSFLLTLIFQNLGSINPIKEGYIVILKFKID